MSLTASAMASLAFALLPSLAVSSGLGLAPGVVAGMAGALLPVNFWSQTFGTNDAAFTALWLAVLCLTISCIWSTAAFSKSGGLSLGILGGLGCLLNPVFLPVLAGWVIATLVRFRKQRLGGLIAFAATTVISVAALLTPWALRNFIALGSFIWTRSNFGLELQVSNNDLLTADLERNVRMPEFSVVHPFSGAAERSRLTAVGEVAYNRSKREEALAWIHSHKQKFLALTAERFRLFWLPRMRRPWQSVLEVALTVAALIGWALLCWRRQEAAWLFGSVLLLYPIVYYVIQVTPRYRFPMEPLLFLLGASAVFRRTPTSS